METYSKTGFPRVFSTIPWLFFRAPWWFRCLDSACPALGSSGGFFTVALWHWSIRFIKKKCLISIENYQHIYHCRDILRYWSTIFYRYSITIIYIDIDVPLVAQCSWWLPRLHHSRLAEITKGHSGHITLRQFDDGTTPTKIAGGSTAIIICWRRHLILSRGFPTVFCLNKCKIGWKKMKSIKTSSKSRWQTQRNSPKELALASLAWQRCWKTVGTFNENCTMFYMPKYQSSKEHPIPGTSCSPQPSHCRTSDRSEWCHSGGVLPRPEEEMTGSGEHQKMPGLQNLFEDRQ